MKCKHIKYLLADYITGKFSGEDNNKISEHLKVCKKCEELRQTITNVFNGLEAVKVAQPSDLYWINLLPRINERISKKEHKSFWQIAHKLFLPVASVIVATFIVIRIFTFNTSTINDNELYLNQNYISVLSENGYDSLGREGVFLVDYIEWINANKDSSVLHKIISETADMFESERININTAVYSLDDKELNDLIAMLEDKR